MSEDPVFYTAGNYRRPGRPGVSQDAVNGAAIDLLRTGQRPSLERIIAITGGSATTIGPLLDEWWKRLHVLIHQLPAFKELPGSLPQLAQAFFMCALDEAQSIKTAGSTEQRRKYEADLDDLDVKAHALQLLEGNLKARVARHDIEVDTLNRHLHEQTLLSRKLLERVNASEARVLELEAALKRRKNPRESAPRTTRKREKAKPAKKAPGKKAGKPKRKPKKR